MMVLNSVGRCLVASPGGSAATASKVSWSAHRRYLAKRRAVLGSIIVLPRVASVRCRCRRIEQFLALELAPEFDRDLHPEAGDVLLHLGDAERAGDHSADRGME